MFEEGRRQILLLVTATVRPQVRERTALLDPTLRVAAYQRALIWWAASLPAKSAQILVVENSGYEWSGWLKALQQDSGVRVRLESYDEKSDLAQGKGAGEALMYDHVIRRLEKEPGLAVDDILKCTGRLSLRTRLGIPTPPAESRYVMCRLARNLQKMDTRFFMLDTGSFLNHFGSLSGDVNESAGIYLEHVACQAALRNFASGATRLSFPNRPLIIGVSGSTGATYRGLRSKLSDYTSKVDRKVSQDYF